MSDHLKADNVQIATSTSNPSTIGLSTANSVRHTTTPEYISYIIPDFKAVKYISDSFQNEFLKLEEVTITGFEIYVVEQWTLERKISNLITTYTGSNLNVVRAIKFTILQKALLEYPKKFQNYLSELYRNHSNLKTFEFGSLHMNNLSSFPSNLNLINVPNGDSREVYDLFTVNSNLRKLRCGGRSGLLLTPPADASEDKFRQMYKINPKVPIRFAVKELANVVQISLFYFDLLNPNFGDGLFCNKTEEAIHSWWEMIGTPHYDIRPKGGLLGPATISAIIGMVLSIRLRLGIAGSDVPKDPFDIENFRLAIGNFQKNHKLYKDWKLNPETLTKLYDVTNLKGATDLKKLRQVVKLTVQDHLGVKSTNQPWDVETTDLDNLINHLSGKKLVNLWYGGEKKFVFSSLYDYVHDTRSSNGNAGNNVNHFGSPALPESSNTNITELIAATELQPPMEEKDISSDEEESAVEPKKYISYKRQFVNSVKRRSSYPSLDMANPEREIRRRNSLPALTTEDSQIISPINLSSKYVKLIKYEKYFQKKLNQLNSREIHQLNSHLNSNQKYLTNVGKNITNLTRRNAYYLENYQILDLKITDMDTLIAKINYETRLLNKRIRDVDLNITQFDAKLTDSSSRLDAIYKSIEPKNELMEQMHRKDDPDSKNWCIKLFNMIYNAFLYLLLGIDVNRIKNLWYRVDKERKFTNNLNKILQEGKDHNK